MDRDNGGKESSFETIEMVQARQKGLNKAAVAERKDRGCYNGIIDCSWQLMKGRK